MLTIPFSIFLPQTSRLILHMSKKIIKRSEGVPPLQKVIFSL